MSWTGCLHVRDMSSGDLTSLPNGRVVCLVRRHLWSRGIFPRTARPLSLLPGEPSRAIAEVPLEVLRVMPQLAPRQRHPIRCPWSVGSIILLGIQ